MVATVENEPKFGAVGPQEAKETSSDDVTQAVGSVQVAVVPS